MTLTKRTMITFLLCVGFTAQAQERKTLQPLIAKYTELYERSGADNNSLYIRPIRTSDVQLIQKRLKLKDLRKLTVNQYFRGIKGCLFIQEGAYGPHISNNTANRLSRAFLYELIRGWRTNPEVYLVRPFRTEIITNNCGLLIVSHSNRESAIVQGYGFD